MLIFLSHSYFSQNKSYSIIIYSSNFTKLSSFDFLQTSDSLLPLDLQNLKQRIRKTIRDYALRDPFTNRLRDLRLSLKLSQFLQMLKTLDIPMSQFVWKQKS